MVVEVTEPAVANTAGDGVRHGACGILGGQDGLPHRYVLKSGGRPDRPLKTKEVGIVIRPGDVLDVRSAGGGGFGDPAGRSAEERARDRLLGFVTIGGSAREAAPDGDRPER
jgi:N-methylhydantoinase B